MCDAPSSSGAAQGDRKHVTVSESREQSPSRHEKLQEEIKQYVDKSLNAVRQHVEALVRDCREEVLAKLEHTRCEEAIRNEALVTQCHEDLHGKFEAILGIMERKFEELDSMREQDRQVVQMGFQELQDAAEKNRQCVDELSELCGEAHVDEGQWRQKCESNHERISADVVGLGEALSHVSSEMEKHGKSCQRHTRLLDEVLQHLGDRCKVVSVLVAMERMKVDAHGMKSKVLGASIAPTARNSHKVDPESTDQALETVATFVEEMGRSLEVLRQQAPRERQAKSSATAVHGGSQSEEEKHIDLPEQCSTSTVKVQAVGCGLKAARLRRSAISGA